MMVSLVIFITILASTLAHPMPQVPTMTGEDRRNGIDPGKCTFPQYSEMIARVVACDKAQDHEYLNDLLLSLDFSNEELRRAICAATWAKMDCFLEEAPLCLNEDRLRRAESNVIKTHFEFLYNHTKTLGKEIMDECSFVQSKQSQLMMGLANSDKCDFYEYETRRIAMQECRAEVRKARSHRLDFLRIAPDPQEYFRRIVCQSREDGLACSKEFKKCLGPERFNYVVNDDAEYYADIEKQAQDIDSGFSYATTCNHGNIDESDANLEDDGEIEKETERSGDVDLEINGKDEAEMKESGGDESEDLVEVGTKVGENREKEEEEAAVVLAQVHNSKENEDAKEGEEDVKKPQIDSRIVFPKKLDAR